MRGGASKDGVALRDAAADVSWPSSLAAVPCLCTPPCVPAWPVRSAQLTDISLAGGGGLLLEHRQEVRALPTQINNLASGATFWADALFCKRLSLV